MAAIHDQCMIDIAALVSGLDLIGAVGVIGDIGTNVYLQTLPEQTACRFPCVLVSTDGETEEEGESNFEEDYVIYPVRIVIVDPMSPNYQSRRATYQRWRHDIARMLRGRVNAPLLPNVPECHDLRVRNLPVLNPGAKTNQFVQSGLTALCHTNETRQRN